MKGQQEKMERFFRGESGSARGERTRNCGGIWSKERTLK